MVSEKNGINENNVHFHQPDMSVINNHVDLCQKNPSDPQVKSTETPRRKFTKAYKLQFLTSYDACSSASERGALLRREGLYQACISKWRHQLGMHDAGKNTTSHTRRSDHMMREIEQLKKKLAQAQAVIDLQKKVSELLGTHILSHDSNEVISWS